MDGLITCRTCPEGFILRKLKEQHAEVVAPSWPGLDDLQAKQNFFKSLIKAFHSIGLFSQEDPDEPIAWCLQHPNGHPGHLYVTEKYRRRGFASLLMKHMCKYIQEDGLVPEACVEESNDCAQKLMKRIGFVEHCKFKILINLAFS